MSRIRAILRRRRKRKVLYVWLVLCVGCVCCLLSSSTGRSLIWAIFTGKGANSTGRSRGQSCDPSRLPSSIQQHCQRYRQGIITGSLCAPLCDRGHICDVRSTYGNAHKEVMVTQCHGFCSPGQSVKAILKHDEVYASSDGYDKFYSTVNSTAGDSSAHRMDSLNSLLHRHLPTSSITDHLLLQMLGEESASPKGNFSSFAFYNTMTLLFRQKEYVLFQAYKSTGIFPRVYGACGPLYLVEFCEPVLQKDRMYGEAVLFNDLLSWNKASSSEPESNNQHVLLDSHNVLLLDRDENSDKGVRKAVSFFFGETLGRLFRSHQSTYDDVHQSSSQPDQFMISDEAEVTNSGSVYVVNLSPGDRTPKSLTGLSWTARAEAALKIFRLLEYMEREETFPEHIHLCDPKLEHFAISTDDGKLKLIDADLVLFDFNMVTDSSPPDVDTGACTEHEDCSDVMCRGWCRKETGRCASRRVNNNLQGVCENVFLRPSLEYGTVFTAIPTAVYDEVSRWLCECATGITDLWEGVPLHLPSPFTRRKLVQVLERSLRVEKSPDLSMPIARGKEGSDLLFEYCQSFQP